MAVKVGIVNELISKSINKNVQKVLVNEYLTYMTAFPLSLKAILEKKSSFPIIQKRGYIIRYWSINSPPDFLPL